MWSLIYKRVDDGGMWWRWRWLWWWRSTVEMAMVMVLEYLDLGFV
ncbi:hypothetical protein HanHA300_Chr11g0397961 [Helianthus annuus]|nr:hypothetical protein HanHA300_Chr11g0397961 [Helianthus annuus]KAJ0517086.1 hypothetical protein HanHA89_Chr11g0421251 [Helianthus annuus]KAJ0689012.1 hypothetical protein HanOQP8_Chr11g0400771 [Helianthus annuus]KAJ0874729.1 hypothetical protein HanPSC8_Chr11g0467701 [Helianthus annuus]